MTALVGLNIQSHGKLDQILEKVSRLDNVTWAAVVTGRYDIFAEVVVTGGTQETVSLHNRDHPTSRHRRKK